MTRMRLVGYAVLWAGVGVLVAMLLSVPYYVSQIRETQVDRLSQNEVNDQTLAIIKDCTDPKGHCYQRGQRRTAEVLASVQRIILLSAACAVDLDPGQPVNVRVQQITDCVTDRLASGPHKR